LKHYLYFLKYLAALAVTIFISFVAIPYTHASSKNVPSPNCCSIELVHLHGSNPPDITCLKREGSSGKISPNTYGSDCSSTTLELYGSDVLGTLTLCFLGTGFINLTDYIWRFWPQTWNDKAYHYRTGCNYGTFFADTNGAGTQQGFNPNQNADFVGHSLRAYTLSSFSITSSC
jgi:hypothetical protein